MTAARSPQPDSNCQPTLPAAPDDAAQQPADDFVFGELRQILVGQEQERIASVSDEVDDLKQLMADKDALAAIIAPSLDSALRDKIQQNRAEMVDVLYPIIGQTVLRAVTEAIQDLARTVDARVRTSITPRAVLRQLKAQVAGVSSAELALRDALPFEVAEIFLIHRPTGLLLRHVSADAETAPDRDLVSGMLTAIRDFAADAFGRGQQSELEAIQYGDRRVLLEAAEHVYVAAVVEGIEPPGFRAALRELVLDVESRYRYVLRNYQGDATAFGALDATLATMRGAPPASQGSRLTRRQKSLLAGAAGLAGVCLLSACLGGVWLVRAVNEPQPTPVVIYVVPPSATPAPTFTATPTASPTTTPTASATPSPTVTATPSPSPTPQRRAVVGDARINVRAGPGLEFPIKQVAVPGDAFNLTGESADRAWVQVCCLPDGTSGWVSAAYLVRRDSP